MWKLFLVALSCLYGAARAYLGTVHCAYGRDVIVHLFEWKWTDIARECPRLANWGYCAVQVSPPQEHALITGVDGVNYPWWQRYQPVSYKMDSRSGSESQFIQMVEACNDVGVYIYVDAIINHMTGGGSGTGSAGSWWSGDEQSYPGVPFGNNDFHGSGECHTHDLNIHDYNNANEVRFCRLVGLRDLRGGSQWVRDQTTGYMNKLIDWGVAGFRIDACKHMFPGDLQAVCDNLHNLNTRWFPGGTRPFVFQEVIDQGGEAISAGEYTGIARVTEFKYSTNIGPIFRKINGQRLSYLRNYGEGWGFMGGMSAVVFIDNHDNQRGHGGAGAVLTYKDARLYKMATAYMLAWAYGYARVMSSYAFTNSEVGPPSDWNGNTNDVECFNGEWVCEHAWRQIHNMVTFHNVALGQPVSNWWDNGWNAIAFGRGDKGFFVINNEDFPLDMSLQTGLPAGEYCDVISCESNRPPCGGCNSVNVDGGGMAHFHVSNQWSDPMIAIHV